MEKFVPYNDKSSAKRGLVRKSPDLKGAEDSYLIQRNGKWGFLSDDKGPILNFVEPVTEPHSPEPEAGGAEEARHIEDQRVKSALENALAKAQALGIPGADPANASAMLASAAAQGAAAALEDPEDDEDDAAPASSASAFGNFMMSQLGNTGTTVTASPRPPVLTKIEKNRAESNGVKRPSAGTFCANVWDLAQSMSHLSETGPHIRIATLSEVMKAAEARGINKFTARTQYARWRVFNGITGRLS